MIFQIGWSTVWSETEHFLNLIISNKTMEMQIIWLSIFLKGVFQDEIVPKL